MRFPVVPLVAWLAAAPAAGQAVPEAIVAEGVPPIPRALVQKTEKYRRVPGNTFAGWFGGRREVLVTTGTEQTAQVFSVVYPGAPWARMTYFSERVTGVWP